MLSELLAAGGMIGQVGGGIAGAIERSNANAKAMQLTQESLNELAAIGIPSEEAQRITLQRLQSQGMLTPELEQNILQGRTEMEGISTDPRLADTEMQALDELRTLGQGGFNIQDKAALDKSLSQSSALERGQREAILQDMAQRGASTSGGALAAQLSNQQGAATRGNEAALDTAAQGYQRALDAIRSGGALAGEMQGRQFNQQAQIKGAQDIINRMNTEAMQGVQTRNIGAMNSAQAANLGEKQRISDANAGLYNQQEIYNKSLPQQTFQNQMNLAGAKSNVRSGQANQAIQGGNQQAATIAGMGAGVGQIGMGLANNMYNSEQNASNRAWLEQENQKNRDAWSSARKA